MKASQLRDLTRRYANGGMTRDAYIAERTRLIDGVVGGEVRLQYRSIEVPNATASTGALRRWWMIGGTLLLIGMLLVAIAAYFLGDADPAKTEPNTTTTVADPGVDLLRNFLREKQWNPAALESFESSWRTLTPFQQESVRRSSAWRQAKHEMNQRILEQEALLAAGEMDALLEAGRLREFAERIGFATE